MRIAQVAPLHESVPPKLYGGTERVVHYLTEELVKMGHEVTLFASKDSQTSARLIPCTERSLRLDPTVKDPLAHHIIMLEKVARYAHQFDIIHFHIDYIHFPLMRRLNISHVTTLHGRLDIPDLKPLYQEFNEAPVVSISNAQRGPLPMARWVATVYHGLPEDLYRFREKPGKYLAFLGRISPEKRPDRAIKIAERAGMKLLIAAKVDQADRAYFEAVIKPLLKSPWVEFIGEINDREKDEFLGNAYALLFPIDWPEPFGLVMIEANACGTPVIAWRCGSVPEIIEHGVNGLIVESLDEAVKAVEKVSQLSRQKCREVFEKRFTSKVMAKNYLAVYESILEQKKPLLKAA
ncbi:glycosyl transferase group 1 [Thermodesulfatator indicus DSM 15286]|uniref:Glycosyl transferase group 1 n=1 Tax=Thermodesulfatator indicus (strain DSM 15286 / JCM 11887 / CIR29812) TaxID=667014 RepID=F8AAG5_THEID|nr:glycosyltransferase family 4 protein [Thermodesulfatator indicus]AEH45385.1 glycosyl transferase group 1 [Thermodesulfatator indicus DSM 15286]